MKLIKNLFKWVLRILLIPLIYIVLAIILSNIPVNSIEITEDHVHTVYLTTNGTHADVILPKELLTASLEFDLITEKSDEFYAFGWGDRDFFINTPTWAELKLSTALKALFTPSETLMHVNRHDQKGSDWLEVKLTEEQLTTLQDEIMSGFAIQKGNTKTYVEGHSYFGHDEFYNGSGSYTCLFTCNTWLNSTMKSCGVKAAVWTPFDFGVLHWHEK
ncbi:MAG: DUF2459 domain-containing protein [Flavobacteriales bacterium]|nr:DUF2459 domain-containing protein [Flavobacteriales bacterium]MDG1780313.1 DUF2459 domain-containing protein [Flavobacteriales bacterium]MDG2247093.1 DUF2459 domain-containing protein [Flavobacteriales bacterium]